MDRQNADSLVIEQLHDQFGIIPRNTIYDEHGSLITLDLSDLELEEVPAELGQFSKLQTLYLSSNELRKVPAELGQLSNLQHLDLSGNLLSEIPAELGQ